MSKLKRLCPELSKLCAQTVHARHQIAVARETEELRAIMAELIRRGRNPADLIKSLQTGDMSYATKPQTTTDTKEENEIRSV